MKRGCSLNAGTLAAIALTMSACSTVSVESKRYLRVPMVAATDPAKVEILRHEPRRPHDRLGEVALSPSGNPPVSEMEAALRSEAARLGADAVVLVQDKTRRMGSFVTGPWWARSHTPVLQRLIIAVAIRYR